MAIWIIIISVGIATYLLRLSSIPLMGRIDVPPSWQRVLRFVPVTVLPAMIAQELVLHSGMPDLSLHNARLLAGLFAVFVAWRTKNVILTIVSGMGVLLIVQAVMG